MYTIERAGGKATARVHGIFSVRFSLLRPPLVGGRGGRGGGTRTGALVRVEGAVDLCVAGERQRPPC